MYTRDSGKWLAELLAFAGVKRESSALLNFVASGAELRFLARVDARWCRREKYKQIRRKTLLYAFEKRMKACQRAWRRRKYKPTFTRKFPAVRFARLSWRLDRCDRMIQNESRD